MSQIIELNIGGKLYSTTVATLTRDPDSLLTKIFSGLKSNWTIERDLQGRYFIDRDGDLFKYILDYLRNDCTIVLPNNFLDSQRLKIEAGYYKLAKLVNALNSVTCSLGIKSISSNPLPAPLSPSTGAGLVPGFITVGYRGSFSFGKDGLHEVKFRKLTRILVAGKVVLCREVFGDALNESRDPDHASIQDRYTSRYYLKHTILEQCFDALQENHFRLVAGCASGTSSLTAEPLKPGQDPEENRWNHYNEFVFCRP